MKSINLYVKYLSDNGNSSVKNALSKFLLDEIDIQELNEVAVENNLMTEHRFTKESKLINNE